MVDVIYPSQSFFDSAIVGGILPLQVSVSDPALITMEHATGMLSPDLDVTSRMAHFDPRLYNLDPSSHLVRFLSVLLGDTGVGQLRKRYTVARLQSVLTSTHFYDLDGFYGALLGAGRKNTERLPFDPMLTVATAAEWDEVAVRDATFRERILALAKSLPMAGTAVGLQQAAEALTGVECDVYETWRLVDAGGSTALGRLWTQVEDLFPVWKKFEATAETWSSVTARVEIGRAGVSNRDEVYVRVKKSYLPTGGTQVAVRESQRLRQEDEFNLIRTLSILKPSGVLLTVDNQGMSPHRGALIANLESDSVFWEVMVRTTPSRDLQRSMSASDEPYALDADGVTSTMRVPPFSQHRGFAWTDNHSITSTSGFALSAEGGETLSPTGTVLSATDWETLDIDAIGLRSFPPGNAIANQRELIGAQLASPPSTVAHPYAGVRERVTGQL